jgi:glycosyltransferase involved in cell wall biosynthesis
MTAPPLRVVHLVETFAIGGAELLLAEALPRLAALGVEVRVRALHEPDTLLPTFRAAGIDAGLLSSGGWGGKASLPGLTRALRRELEVAPADVLHTHLAHATLVGRAAVAASLRRPRLVRSLHAPQYKLFADEGVPRWRVALQRVLDRGSELALREQPVAVSHAVARDHLGRASGEHPGVEVVHNALDVTRHVAAVDAIDRDAARRSWDLEPHELAILSVGRLLRSKDFPMVVSAIRALRERGVAARGLVIGDGPDRAALTALGGDVVRFVGPAPRERVLSALVACDLYAQASRYEAFGMAILEAMAASRAVVATAVDGVPEVVEGGETGLLVAAGDGDAFVRALLALHEDPARRAAMGRAGRARAAARFDVDVWARSTRDLYLDRAGRR